MRQRPKAKARLQPRLRDEARQLPELKDEARLQRVQKGKVKLQRGRKVKVRLRHSRRAKDRLPHRRRDKARLQLGLKGKGKLLHRSRDKVRQLHRNLALENSQLWQMAQGRLRQLPGVQEKRDTAMLQLRLKGMGELLHRSKDKVRQQHRNLALESSQLWQMVRGRLRQLQRAQEKLAQGGREMARVLR